MSSKEFRGRKEMSNKFQEILSKKLNKHYDDA
jgi:hypothetical protein